MDKELLEYFNGDELAANVWLSKYAQNGETNPNQMHKRMAKEFARIDQKYQIEEKFLAKNGNEADRSTYGLIRKDLTGSDIYELFKDFKYIIPQGSIMSILGTNQIASLSNCWVAENPVDSYAGIHKTDGDLIYYYKRRGGVGIDISNLRPANTATNNTAKSSTGAISFMSRFSNTTREVAMNGRRGALMLSIDVNHPDVMEFIKIKRDLTKVTGANISIRLNNDFMKAVENDEDYFLTFPCSEKDFFVPEGLEYNKLYKSQRGADYVKRIKAKEYWDEIVKSAKDYAEPGLMYWDNVLDNDPCSVYEEYKPISSNPCGEQMLNANDSCRLMAINLYSFVENNFIKDAKINEIKLYEVCYEALRLGDNLVDLEAEYIDRIIDKIKSDPEPTEIKQQELNLWVKSKEKCLSGRRVGLGITALGDMLAALNLQYGSEESLKVIEKVMKIKMEAELDATIDLSILRGSFKGWDLQKEFGTREGDYYQIGNAPLFFGNNSFYNMLIKDFPKQAQRMYQYGRRNVSWSTVNGGFIK